MLNKVILMGRLTKEPELKMTQSGTEVSGFTLAVERDYGAAGERQTDFINCVAFKKAAEFLTKYFVKGQLICVCGMLQTRQWEDAEGKKRFATEVIANEIKFTGDNRKKSESKESGFIDADGDSLPF